MCVDEAGALGPPLAVALDPPSGRVKAKKLTTSREGEIISLQKQLTRNNQPDHGSKSISLLAKIAGNLVHA